MNDEGRTYDAEAAAASRSAGEAIRRVAAIEEKLADQEQATADPRQRPWLKKNQFPTRENCNPNCPEEAFVWMLVGKPGLKGAPLDYPLSYMPLVSRRIWDCGGRPADCDDDFKTTAAPVIKYRRPANDSPNWLTSPGKWVDINEPDRPVKPLAKIIGAMPIQDRAAAKAAAEQAKAKAQQIIDELEASSGP